MILFSEIFQDKLTLNTNTMILYKGYQIEFPSEVRSFFFVVAIVLIIIAIGAIIMLPNKPKV